ncbi:MAG: HAD family phosphatase [Desulfuromonadaceae bacterium]|nr:HAD family phosphatase [Desulfuromonadaceae bacterium]
MILLGNRLQSEAVIFDFDGVIVDTEPLHYKSFQRVLEPLELGFSWQDYVDIYMGYDDRDAFLEAFEAGGRKINSDDLLTLIRQKALLFQDVIRDGVSPYPGVIELIHRLRAEKIPLAICSGALRSDIDPILTILGLEECFDIIVTAEDVSRSKPDPECYQLALDKLCHLCKIPHAKSSTIAIEDTPAGIISAKLAGLQVIAVSNSYPPDKLSEASFVTDSLQSLVDFVFI